MEEQKSSSGGDIDDAVVGSRRSWTVALRPLEWTSAGVILDHSRAGRSKVVTENGDVIRESRSVHARMRYFLSRSEVSLSSRVDVMQSERLCVEMEYWTDEDQHVLDHGVHSGAIEYVAWVIDDTPASIAIDRVSNSRNQFGETKWIARVKVPQMLYGSTVDAWATVSGYTPAVQPLTWKTFPVDSMTTLTDPHLDRPVWPGNYW